MSDDCDIKCAACGGDLCEPCELHQGSNDAECPNCGAEMVVNVHVDVTYDVKAKGDKR